MIPGTPIPARVTVRPDRSFHFEVRTPTVSHLLLTAANAPIRKNKIKGSGKAGTEKENVGTVSLKHVYEIAKIKQSEPRLSGSSLKGIVQGVIASAKSMGVEVVP